MRWYQQDSDCHGNLKVENLLDKWKMIGYGVLIVCREMVAKEITPDNLRFSIPKKKNWKNHLRKVSSISTPTLEKILEDLANFGLISKKGYQRGCLSIPQMRKRCDEYIDKILREKGGNRDKKGSELGHKKKKEHIKINNNKKDSVVNFLINTLKDWNERQSSPIADFKPENIINKYGMEKIEALIKKYGKENNGFNLFLTHLRDENS